MHTYTPDESRLRVLIVAEACNPDWSSVPLVGYQMSAALARQPGIAATVVTHIRNRKQVELSELARTARMVYIDSDTIAGPLYRLGRWLRGGDGLGFTTNTAAAWPGYVWFEHLISMHFAAELAQGGFDLVHRITPVSPSLAGPLVERSRVPVVIGPINGGLSWPKDYEDLRDQEREKLTPIRGIYRLMPYHRSTYQQAAAVLCGSRSAVNHLPKHAGLRMTMPENGIDPSRFPIAECWPEPKNRFRFIFSGRLVPCKGVRFILDAFAKSTLLSESELIIAGDGPLKADLQQQALNLSIQDRVQFTGWLPQQQLSEIMRSSQAFVFPSVREFGGGAALEAMAVGLPCIVADHGGPAELVTDQCGLIIPLQPRHEMVSRLQSAMEYLFQNPDQCRIFGKQAIDRVRNQFTWDIKASHLLKYYQQIVEQR